MERESILEEQGGRTTMLRLRLESGTGVPGHQGIFQIFTPGGDGESHPCSLRLEARYGLGLSGSCGISDQVKMQQCSSSCNWGREVRVPPTYLYDILINK